LRNIRKIENRYRVLNFRIFNYDVNT